MENKTEKIGFHGFRTTDPLLITHGDEGFDLRYSKVRAYGKANYFAEEP